MKGAAAAARGERGGGVFFRDDGLNGLPRPPALCSSRDTFSAITFSKMNAENMRARGGTAASICRFGSAAIPRDKLGPRVRGGLAYENGGTFLEVLAVSYFRETGFRDAQYPALQRGRCFFIKKP